MDRRRPRGGLLTLEPADLDQCQAEKPNPSHGPFRLGGAVERLVRCTAKPAFVAIEVEPGPDGLCGEMSVCTPCRGVLDKQYPGRARYETVALRVARDALREVEADVRATLRMAEKDIAPAIKRRLGVTDSGRQDYEAWEQVEEKLDDIALAFRKRRDAVRLALARVRRAEEGP